MQSLVIQSVRFQKKLFTISEAKKILIEKVKLIPIKTVDISKSQFRFRIIDPKFFNKKSFRTHQDMNIKGLSYVMGKILKSKSIKKKKEIKIFNPSETPRPIKKLTIKKQFTFEPVRRKKKEKPPLISVLAFPFRR